MVVLVASVVLLDSLLSWPFLLFAFIALFPTLLVLGVWGTVGFIAARAWRRQEQDLSIVLMPLFLAPVALYCYMAIATEYRVAQGVKAMEHKETIVPVTNYPKVLYIYSIHNVVEGDLDFIYEVGRLMIRTAIETIVLPRRGVIFTKSADENCQPEVMRGPFSSLDAHVSMLRRCVKKETRPSVQPDTSAVGLHLVGSGLAVNLPGKKRAYFGRRDLRAKDGSSDKLMDTHVAYSFERFWPIPIVPGFYFPGPGTPIGFYSTSVKVPPGNSLTTVDFLLRSLGNP